MSSIIAVLSGFIYIFGPMFAQYNATVIAEKAATIAAENAVRFSKQIPNILSSNDIRLVQK